MKRSSHHRTAKKTSTRLVCIMALLVCSSTVRSQVDVPTAVEVHAKPLTLSELIELPEEDLAKVDIATMNLVAAYGLPGSEKLDIPSAPQRREY